MSIATKTGDQGDTGRFGGGRISKTDVRIEAIGSIDELNSAIGLICARNDISEEIMHCLHKIQESCFCIGSALSLSETATAHDKEYIPRIKQSDVEFLEREIDAIENRLKPQRRFILPGGSPSASMCFWLRTIARRAERVVVQAHEQEPVDEQVLPYLNRLSDYFYVLARFLNQEQGIDEIEWQGGH